MMRRYFFCLAFVGCLAAQLLQAQDAFTRIVGEEDQEIAMPGVTPTRGQKDAGAIQELIGFLKATQLAGFRDMKGTGTAVLPEEDGASLPATMFLQGMDKFRLDIQTAEGTRTLLVRGATASVEHETKGHYSLPTTAAALQIMAFARPALTDFSQPGLSLLDRGMVTVDGTALHRITLQTPFSRKKADQSGHDVDLAMDLYFDPSSHLLVKSAAAVRLNDSRGQDYLRVTTYEDYRQVNGVLFPFGYHETLNGQREWTLDLKDIQLNSGTDSSIFQLNR